MADQILDQVRDVAEGQIDFEGQKLADLLATIVLSASGVLSFIIGYLLQDIKLAVYVGLAGTVLTFLLVVPPWPFYKQHPVKWLELGSRTGSGSVHGTQNITTVEKSG
ncbi:microsomal signal peptidase 12 kDa subunit [Colletotrichum somersetense]|nr:microsomal signal peptidase 12 kDa subunit [Colletotrichum somersetense]